MMLRKEAPINCYITLRLERITITYTNSIILIPPDNFKPPNPTATLLIVRYIKFFSLPVFEASLPFLLVQQHIVLVVLGQALAP